MPSFRILSSQIREHKQISPSTLVIFQFLAYYLPPQFGNIWRSYFWKIDNDNIRKVQFIFSFAIIIFRNENIVRAEIFISNL